MSASTDRPFGYEQWLRMRRERSRLRGLARRLRSRLREWTRARFSPRVKIDCAECGTLQKSVSLQEMVEHRDARCRVCEHRIGTFCALCWCFLPVKQRIAGAACPDERW